jgi:hypothetical protein
MLPPLRITGHAVKRFNERIMESPASDADVLVKMLECLRTAKEKHFKKIGKKTFYIPTDVCLFICEKDAIVTVVKRNKLAVSVSP